MFFKNFDRNDPSYHKGDQRPVPLGGSRIPEGMEGEPVPINSSSELGDKIKAVRAMLITMKDKIRKGTQIKATERENYVPNSELIKDLENDLSCYKNKLEEYKEDIVDSTRPEEAVQIMRTCFIETPPPRTPEEWHEFNTSVAQATRLLFQEASRLLEMAKKAK